ncbi:MAG: cytochrome b N-terminal domain-containing protein [Emcibacteraceae bacterium]|nr:cytochrome b N-terminal domain-containing protein [Emcibacteraceae bacterium]
MASDKKFKPTSPNVQWLEDRLPILGLVYGSLGAGYNAPRNLNYWWNFGSLALFMLVIQIITGIVLVMHYVPHVDMAFDSVQHIRRDVNYGWLIQAVHANGASMFFMVIYIHILRGFYFGSYKAPREILWFLGIIIYLLMMATGFMGYVLPWGQMSFWGAKVITNLFGAFDFIPFIGDGIVEWLWGGFAVGQPTLNRFLSLHYLLPFVLIGVVILHIWALHIPGSTNPLGIDAKGPYDKIPFHPYYTAKDAFGLGVFIIFFASFVFYIPDFLGHPDNYVKANPLVTPAHIVPEWYYLPFYAILRAIPNELIGVVAMFASILILFAMPWLDASRIRSLRFRPLSQFFFWIFAVNGLFLGYLGQKAPDDILFASFNVTDFSRVSLAYYFGYFLVVMPLVSRMETTKPIPTSIAAAVLDANKKG